MRRDELILVVIEIFFLLCFPLRVDDAGEAMNSLSVEAFAYQN